MAKLCKSCEIMFFFRRIPRFTFPAASAIIERGWFPSDITQTIFKTRSGVYAMKKIVLTLLTAIMTGALILSACGSVPAKKETKPETREETLENVTAPLPVPERAVER